MFQFVMMHHNKSYEIEGVDTKNGTSMSIFVTQNKRLATMLCRGLSHAYPAQCFSVFKGWTGETDRKELERLNKILNNGSLFYRPLTEDVISESDLYSMYKSVDRNETWVTWLNRRIKNGTIAKEIPLLECADEEMEGETFYDKRAVSA